ncbi:MAG: TetR/AcrR family transcriptional regulator [Chloroflexi bacterium]|nr:TetR/AcrR family transcriptional regulator [Chloroflexota bacterium]
METATSYGTTGAATRSLILSTARDLFAERGYKGTTVREIARRCRITDPALYYHFRSKQDLMQAVLEDAQPPAIALDFRAAGTHQAVATYFNRTFRYWSDNLATGRALLLRSLDGDHNATGQITQIRQGLDTSAPAQLEGVYGANSNLVGLGMLVLGAGLFIGETIRATRITGRRDDSTVTRSRVSAAVEIGCPAPEVAQWAATVPLPPRHPRMARPILPTPRSGAEQTRLNILEAALVLFSERGFSATTVKSIAARCGLTDAALYYHFQSKAEILESLAELPQSPVLPPAPEGPLTLEWLAQLIDCMLDALETDRDAIRLALRQILQGNSVVAGERYLVARSWWQSLLSSCEATYPADQARARADIVAAIRIGIPHTLLIEAEIGTQTLSLDALRPMLLRAAAALLPVGGGLSAS